MSATPRASTESSGSVDGLLTGTVGPMQNMAASPGIRSVSMTLGSTGTMSGTGASLPNWFTPTTSDIGSAYHVSFAVTQSLSTVNSPALNTWHSLAAGKSISISSSTTHNSGEGTITVSLSANGGTTTAATFTCSYIVGYAA